MSGRSSVDGGPVHVWIVDDSPLQAEIAKRFLAGHTVEAFDSAEPALERLALGKRPDIILLDWQMPGISGLEACRLVRNVVDRAALPIIFVTASERREDLEEGLAAGANDFVRKPFEPAELKARIASLVETKRLHHRLANTETLLRDEAAFREQFLAILAHDLRQPLNAISLGSGILTGDEPTAAMRTSIAGKMTRASERMQRMIGELLDFSRARPGSGMPIVPRATNFANVVRDVVGEIRLAHPSRRIDVEVAGACEGSWDADRLAQVVSNLVENALAHSPPDSAVSLTLSSDGGRIHLAVENGGPAIEAAILPTIFDAFRGSPGASRSGNLGLGLYIVAQIVRAHGGTVSVSSVEGRTRFEVSLPRAPRSAA